MTDQAKSQTLRPLSEQSISLIQSSIRNDLIFRKAWSALFIAAGWALTYFHLHPTIETDFTALSVLVIFLVGLFSYLLAFGAYTLIRPLNLLRADRVKIEGGTLATALFMDIPLDPISTQDLINLREDQLSFPEIGYFFEAAREQGREIVYYEHEMIESHMEDVRRAQLYRGAAA